MNNNYRVTSDQVRTIMDVSPSMPVDLTAFIKTAHYLADSMLTQGGLGLLAIDSWMDADMLAEIEKYLAAHFVCLQDPRSNSEGASGVSVSYELGTPGNMLMATVYGRQACALDHSQRLRRLSESKFGNPALIHALGKDLED